MAPRVEPGRRYALANNQLNVHDMTSGSGRCELDKAGLREALGDISRIRLDGLDSLDDALARFTNGAS